MKRFLALITILMVLLTGCSQVENQVHSEEESHLVSPQSVQENEKEKVMFTCGNTITKLTVDGKTYEFEGGNSVWLSQLLADLEYKLDKLCKCLPEIQVDTEHKLGYGISLGESPYARCDEGQADLTKEQAERIQQIIDDVKSGKLFGE